MSELEFLMLNHEFPPGGGAGKEELGNLQTNLYVIAHKLYISGTPDGEVYENGALGQTL